MFGNFMSVVLIVSAGIIILTAVLYIIVYFRRVDQPTGKYTNSVFMRYNSSSIPRKMRKAENECSRPNSPIRNVDDFMDFALSYLGNDRRLLENKIVQICGEE